MPQNFHVWICLLTSTSTLPFTQGDGVLRRSTFGQEIACEPRKSAADTDRLGGSISCLDSIRNDRTKERLIIGGTDTGTIAVWEYPSVPLSPVLPSCRTEFLHFVLKIVDTSSEMDGVSQPPVYRHSTSRRRCRSVTWPCTVHIRGRNDRCRLC